MPAAATRTASPPPEWRNWAGNQSCRPAVMAAPHTRDEVIEAVLRAGERGQHVRVAGASHSFTDTVATDGALLSLRHCSRVLDVDRQRLRLRVEAGITLRDLNQALADNGMAMPNLGDIDSQSIAGATATGTHGTGAALQNLSAALQSIEIVTAQGTVIEVDAERDPEAWRAARVGLGALGIVTAVTIQAEPAYPLSSLERPMPIDEVLDRFEELTAAHRHFQLFAFAHSPLAITATRDRTEELPAPRSRVGAWVSDELLQNEALRAVAEVGRIAPWATPALQRLGTRLTGTSRRVERSDRILTTPLHVRFVEMEYAIPREHTVDAVREIRALARRPEYNVTFPIEVRWVAGDDAYLSPAGGRETCYIAVHQYYKQEWESFFRAAERVFDAYEGRPHWGKQHFQTADDLQAKYPDWESFAAVRRRLDPDGRFANAYTDRVLGAA